MDQLRIQICQLVVLEAEALSRRGPEVLDQDIGGFEQREQNLPALRLAEIEGEALLVAIERAKARAIALVLRIAAAVGVAFARQLDFDDLAAEIAEQAAGVGSGDVAPHVDRRRSFERAVDHLIFRKAFSGSRSRRFP